MFSHTHGRPARRGRWCTAPTLPLVPDPPLSRHSMADMPAKATFSRAPICTIDVESLVDSRFFLRAVRQLPYRDEQGRINVHLLHQAVDDVEQGLVAACEETVTKMLMWTVKARRWLAANPTREQANQAAVASSKMAAEVRGSHVTRGDDAASASMDARTREKAREDSAATTLLHNDKAALVQMWRDNSLSLPDGGKEGVTEQGAAKRGTAQKVDGRPAVISKSKPFQQEEDAVSHIPHNPHPM